VVWQFVPQQPGVVHSHPSVSGPLMALQSLWPGLHMYVHVVPTHDGAPVLVSQETPQAPQLVVLVSDPQPPESGCELDESSDDSDDPSVGGPDSLAASGDPLDSPPDDPLEEPVLEEPLPDPVDPVSGGVVVLSRAFPPSVAVGSGTSVAPSSAVHAVDPTTRSRLAAVRTERILRTPRGRSIRRSRG
jgi:hypothetical protein